MNQRDEYPFKQIRTILEQEHLVFLTPDPKQEEKARRILRLIKDSAATSKHLDPDEFFLAQHSALRRLGTARARDYETELYRVFPVLRPPE